MFVKKISQWLFGLLTTILILGSSELGTIMPTIAAEKTSPVTSDTTTKPFNLPETPLTNSNETTTTPITSGDPLAESSQLQLIADDTYLDSKTTPTTTVHAITNLDTGTSSWLIDDPSLATINNESAVVTANSTGKTGIVTVTGTLTNPDGTTQSATTKITIGQLEQSESNTVQANKNIKTSKAAAITNKALVNATAIVTDPDVVITTTLEDITNNTGNTEHALNNVQDGDDLKMSGTITKNNPDSKLNEADIMIQVPDNIKNTYLYIDGANRAYSTTQINGVSYIVAGSLDFNKNTTSHSYEFYCQSMETTDLSFHGKVQIQAYDNTGGDLGIIDGPDFLLNFTEGQLKCQANDVDFGTLTYANVGKSVTGAVEDNANLLTVTDNRRDRSAMSITLKQDTPFMDGAAKLKAILSFNDGSGNDLIPITEVATTVASSSDDSPVPSIGANNGQDLELTLSNQTIQTGTYTSTLDWAITGAP